ncbi:hypothetical protein C1H46_043417 [Malus baccata]|uniref:Transcription repressor n=1 Tax=Malus baccata TaxID=106549 RepID=A0A540KA23_MALBA|nr:hypothetical protein C1H46_043417 [Malus baccata]
MSSSSKKKKLLTTILTANVAGCGCGRPKLSDVYEPTPKPKIQIHKNPIHRSLSSSSSGDQNGKSFTVEDDDEDRCTSTTVSFNNNNSSSQSHPSDSAESTNPKNTKISSPNTMKVHDSIAVVKESNDPYKDFRQSMLQMIVEKQIYSKDDMQELLSCFLELNSASHHDVIIRAFTQIWNDLIRESEKPMIM